MKDYIIDWLKTKNEEDIVFVKRNPEFSIFLKHPGMTRYEAKKLVEEPEKIISVEHSLSHDDRLVIIKKQQKHMMIEYIILDPRNPDLEERFKDKVAIVTYFPIRQRQSS
ncbi:MAG: hypothetical protein ACLFTR_05265 [Candidatus Woesearchaeota archaeon]